MIFVCHVVFIDSFDGYIRPISYTMSQHKEKNASVGWYHSQPPKMNPNVPHLLTVSSLDSLSKYLRFGLLEQQNGAKVMGCHY